ncbi:RES family NAD+ phosphorylase [Pelobium manganitolerans]|uniref:RES family NAD+ phosphorylase n=1 Tax=Pelobium manganitolerans TaxID=1842495 RepID=UPI003FA397FC
MLVYKICRDIYADHLSASGIANRWNKEDEFVIYTGSSIALSVLENIAHRASINISNRYRLITIALDGQTSIKEIKSSQLPISWQSLDAYPHLQDVGSLWYQQCEHLVLKVPSAIVAQEFNYIINTKHTDFGTKVKIIKSEEWVWDSRLL